MNTNALTLTPDQQIAADAFGVFLASTDTEFVLSGGAGVGKTTLLRHIMASKDGMKICHLLGRPVINTWYLTATTNKAAEVLSQTVPGYEVTTIHSLLGLRVVNDFETGKTEIKRTGKSTVIENAIIVIDECSMVDTQLQKFIGEGTHNCKIVYVGDHCQMAPVMEQISPVFKTSEPFYINQIVRSQNAPPISALCKQLRQAVETLVFPKIEASPGFIDYLDADQAQAEIQTHFVDNGMDHAGDHRIMFYRNASVLQMNKWIRTQRHLPDEFIPGEFVISNSVTKSIHSNKITTRIEEELEILDTKFLPNHDISNLLTIKASLDCYQIDTPKGSFLAPAHQHEVTEALKALKKAKNWGAFFALKENLADLRMRDACTVYKAQGSTYHTAFVSLSDLGTCHNPNQFARMLYVACSRATHRICFIGQLPAKYSGE